MGKDITFPEIRAQNERLIATIAAYWIEQGYEPPVFFEAFCGNYTGRSSVPTFRSDMVNGWPRRKA